MIKEVNIEDILFKENIKFIDVRSELEYMEDTIPGAINMPILFTEERNYVGYLYKQIDKEVAKEVGLDYASKKLVDFYKKVKDIKKEGKEVALFCYRGGMRSNSVASILDLMGLNVYLVKGGYKKYRSYLLENINKYIDKHKYIVIHGYTGVGKTKILNALKEKNEPVLDLEYIAKNSGSVFGNIKYSSDKVYQKMFESKIFETLVKNNKNYIFVESESKRIGQVIIPDKLYTKMSEGYHVLIETNLNNRIENIYDDYINIDDLEKDLKIIEAVNRLRKRLGNKIVDELIERVKSRDYKVVIEKLMLEYYDPLYKYSIDKLEEYDIIIRYETIDEAINELIEFKDKLHI